MPKLSRQTQKYQWDTDQTEKWWMRALIITNLLYTIKCSVNFIFEHRRKSQVFLFWCFYFSFGALKAFFFSSAAVILHNYVKFLKISKWSLWNLQHFDDIMQLFCKRNPYPQLESTGMSEKRQSCQQGKEKWFNFIFNCWIQWLWIYENHTCELQIKSWIWKQSSQ